MVITILSRAWVHSDVFVQLLFLKKADTAKLSGVYSSTGNRGLCAGHW